MDLFVKLFAGLFTGLPPLVALLLLGSVIVNVVLWREFRASERGRLADNQLAIRALAEVSETNRAVASSLEHRNQVTRELIKSVDDVAVLLRLQSQTIDHLTHLSGRSGG